MKCIKKIILICMLGLSYGTVYSQTDSVETKQVNIDNTNFKTYSCKNGTLKEVCLRYESDVEVFNERKENFKKNRITYFFNPEKLVEGFSTPEVFNRLMDDAFKNLKKSDITPMILKQTNSMSMVLKEKFEKNVKGRVAISVNDKDDKMFIKDYHNSVLRFKRKLEIFHWLMKDMERIKEFQATYVENKNELEGQPEKMLMDKGDSVKCVAIEYELLKKDKWNSRLSCHLK